MPCPQPALIGSQALTLLMTKDDISGEELEDDKGEGAITKAADILVKLV